MPPSAQTMETTTRAIAEMKAAIANDPCLPGTLNIKGLAKVLDTAMRRMDTTRYFGDVNPALYAEMTTAWQSNEMRNPHPPSRFTAAYEYIKMLLDEGEDMGQVSTDHSDFMKFIHIAGLSHWLYTEYRLTRPTDAQNDAEIIEANVQRLVRELIMLFIAQGPPIGVADSDEDTDADSDGVGEATSPLSDGGQVSDRIQIFVQDTNGVTITVENPILSTWDCNDVLAYCGLAGHENLRLTGAGRPLVPGNSLESYQIGSGCTLHLLGRLPGGGRGTSNRTFRHDLVSRTIPPEAQTEFEKLVAQGASKKELRKAGQRLFPGVDKLEEIMNMPEDTKLHPLQKRLSKKVKERAVAKALAASSSGAASSTTPSSVGAAVPSSKGTAAFVMDVIKKFGEVSNTLAATLVLYAQGAKMVSVRVLYNFNGSRYAVPDNTSIGDLLSVVVARLLVNDVVLPEGDYDLLTVSMEKGCDGNSIVPHDMRISELVKEWNFSTHFDHFILKTREEAKEMDPFNYVRLYGANEIKPDHPSVKMLRFDVAVHQARKEVWQYDTFHIPFDTPLRALLDLVVFKFVATYVISRHIKAWALVLVKDGMYLIVSLSLPAGELVDNWGFNTETDKLLLVTQDNAEKFDGKPVEEEEQLVKKKEGRKKTMQTMKKENQQLQQGVETLKAQLAVEKTSTVLDFRAAFAEALRKDEETGAVSAAAADAEFASQLAMRTDKKKERKGDKK